MAELAKFPGVLRVQGDQCQYGAEARHGKHRGRPVKKPTGFLTNAECVANALSKRCMCVGGACSRPEGGYHITCQGQTAKDMAIYPKALCRAVLRVAAAQLRMDRRLKPGCFGIQAIDDDEEIHELTHTPKDGYSGKYRDDLTGQVLKDSLVKEARAKELGFFHSKGVWLKVPRQKAMQMRTHLRKLIMRP